MPDAVRQIFAYSGVLNPQPGQRTSAELTAYAIGLAPGDGPKRVCYVPTATGDAQAAVDGMTGRIQQVAPHVAFSVLKLFTQPSVRGRARPVHRWPRLPAVQQRGPRRPRRSAPPALR